MGECIHTFASRFCSSAKFDTVDGRNPKQPVDMVNIPLFRGFYTSKVVHLLNIPCKWKMGAWKMTLVSKGAISTSMIMGGRVNLILMES